MSPERTKPAKAGLLQNIKNKQIMTHLMQIETEFLNSANSEMLGTIALANEIRSETKKGFDKQLKLAQQFNQAMLWFRKSETKEMLAEAGIEWSTEKDFVERVFQWNYTSKYHNKLMRVAKLMEDEPAVVTKFKRACTSAENNGERAVRTVANLMKFAGQLEQQDKPEVAKPKTYVSLSVAKDGINGEKGFSARVTAEGIVTNGELDDSYLNGKVTDLLRQMNEVVQLLQREGVL